jgi:glycosyltransferase involved in cell wall biosynthesis
MEAVERRVLRNADPVYVLSDYTADRVAERHGVSKSGIETVPYPVDTTLFSPDGERENLPSEGPTLLFVGRFNDPRKNVKLLVDAIAQLRDDHDLNATLLLVGAAPDSNLTEYVAARGLSSAVEYVEYVKNETLPAYYRAADAFVIPSNQEGLAIVGLEAMACGTPVVSTRCGGPEGYVEDGETGYLVPTDDKAALADRLARLLSDDDLRQEMGRSAHALVNSSYAESVVGPRFTAALTELVERTT